MALQINYIFFLVFQNVQKLYTAKLLRKYQITSLHSYDIQDTFPLVYLYFFLDLKPNYGIFGKIFFEQLFLYQSAVS
jgi:hypothetical protein